SVDQVKLSLSNSNADLSKPISKLTDCVDKFKIIIDSCDGDNSVNNPHNYKFGGSYTSDGWEYKLEPQALKPTENSCDITYQLVANLFEIRGKNFPDGKLGANGEGLKKEIEGCGALTFWEFFWTPNDVKYQWFASGNLPFGTKSCVGSATQSAGYSEQTKIAVRKSRVTALLRALTHIFTIGFAIWEIELNWNKYFVGYTIYNQAYYQIDAKIQEIAIVASLSAVNFTYVRYELMIGDGIPFGALFSGLQQYLYVMSEPSWVGMVGHVSLRRLISGSPSFVPKGYESYTPIGTTRRSAIGDALSTEGQLWENSMVNILTKGHGNVLQRHNAVHSIKEGYFQPYTTGWCALDAIYGPEDASSISFPAPAGVRQGTLISVQINESILHGGPSTVCPGVTKDQIFGAPGSLEEFWLKWVDLPQDPFNGSAIGAVILPPRSPANLTQDIMVCTLGAGWGSSIVNHSSVDDASYLRSVITLSNAGFTTRDLVQTVIAPLVQAPPIEDTNIASAFFLPYFPQQLVKVTEGWAGFLNHVVVGLNKTIIDILISDNPKTIERMIPRAQSVLGLLLANGLSTIGATATLQGDIMPVEKHEYYETIDRGYWFPGKGDMFTVDLEETKDWVELRVHSPLSGYAYNLHSVSSTCWDSIGEVMALAMNSTPTTLLRNTCAGIVELDVFKIPVRVLAFRDVDGEVEHLELVFGNMDNNDKETKGTVIKPNRVYGTLPRGVEKTKKEWEYGLSEHGKRLLVWCYRAFLLVITAICL
ncbi:MAG: hypothetical protein Q9224_003670, partial [Gallowayella concinna]